MTDKKLINEWDIIDTFFRDTDYYKSQHQIDSFDEFIFSNQKGVYIILLLIYIIYIIFYFSHHFLP